MKFRDQSGSSLVGVMIAVGAVTTLAALVSNTTTKGLAFQKKTALHLEIDFVKQTIADSLDCEKTLKIDSQTNLPLSCRDFRRSVPIRRFDDSILNPDDKLGEWTVNASCPAGQNEIIISLTKEGRDPVTKKPWSRRSYAKDLYGGVSDFCRGYFSNQGDDDEEEPDLECFWGYRDESGISTEQRNRFAKLLTIYNDREGSENWYGLRCARGYNRTGCSIRTTQAKGDFDVRYIDRGCFTDDEEWRNEAKLFINCCRLAKKS